MNAHIIPECMGGKPCDTVDGVLDVDNKISWADAALFQYVSRKSPVNVDSGPLITDLCNGILEDKNGLPLIAVNALPNKSHKNISAVFNIKNQSITGRITALKFTSSSIIPSAISYLNKSLVSYKFKSVCSELPLFWRNKCLNYSLDSQDPFDELYIPALASILNSCLLAIKKIPYKKFKTRRLDHLLELRDKISLHKSELNKQDFNLLIESVTLTILENCSSDLPITCECIGIKYPNTTLCGCVNLHNSFLNTPTFNAIIYGHSI